jgi:hypothetical protein
VSPSTTKQTGFEIIFPDFLPITLSLISRYRARRSFKLSTGKTRYAADFAGILNGFVSLITPSNLGNHPCGAKSLVCR